MSPGHLPSPGLWTSREVVTVAEISFGEMRAIAARLGHSNVRVVELRNGAGWRAECNCGYRSTRRPSEAAAVKTAVQHFVVIVNGTWWKPKFVGGPSRAEVLARDLRGRAKTARHHGNEDEAVELDRLADAAATPPTGTRHAGNEPSKLRAVG